VRVLEAASARHGLRLQFQEFPWNCDWYKAHGKMCPDDAADILRKFDAIYFGAVGNPSIVPDHIAVWGLLINFRRWFDLYVNLRPVRLFQGLPCPLAGRKPGDLDYYVVRENTEGEYSNVGGRMFEGTEREVVVQQSTFSRKGVDRIMRYSFELARKRKKHLTSCTKSNGITITMPYWDERFAEMKKQFPDVRTDQYHVDGLTIQMVLNPDRFDVIVASNLFGDILSDLGPATAGTIGIAPSGNINPTREYPSIFEPVHGSAPDIAGRKIANPIGQIWSGALMLEHLGHAAAAADIVSAIEKVVLEGPHTPDMKGKASTSDVGGAVAEVLRSQSKKAA
jgi:tartrate dehydrogenase/decarboxylase/D-malate dehydrogenase